MKKQDIQKIKKYCAYFDYPIRINYFESADMSKIYADGNDVASITIEIDDQTKVVQSWREFKDLCDKLDKKLLR